MLRSIAAATLLATTACQSAEEAPQMAAETAIVDVTVIDVETGEAIPGQTVLISDKMIVAVGLSSDLTYTATRTLDGTGRYLMPGLIDMHVHIDRAGLPAFPLNGVTTIRDMGTQIGPLEPGVSILGSRAGVEAGTVFGPEIFTSALLLDGPVERNPQWAPHYRSIETASEAVAIVDDLAALDVDFIKVYSSLKPYTYRTIAARAALHGLSIAGHIPDAVGAREAIEVGLTTIEHQRDVLLSISSDEDVLRPDFIAASADGDPSGTYRLRQQVSDRLVETMDEEKAQALYAQMKANGVAAVPTLIVLTDPRWHDPDAEIAPDILSRFSPIYQRIVGGGGPVLADYETIGQARRHYEAYAKVTRDMYEAGVDVLAGTDAANPYVVPGYALHQELILLNEAGLPADAVLRGATSLAAKHLGAGERIGRIGEGYEADLVLLSANPLDAIGNTQAIEQVLLDGAVYSPAEIEALWLAD